jgi:hypothetical protein
MIPKLVVQVTTTDKALNKYPDIFIEEIEDSLVLIWSDYEVLGKLRQRVTALKWAIENRQGELKYGHLKKYEPIVDTGDK